MIKQILFIVWGTLFLVNGVFSQNQKVVDSLQWLLKNRIGAERFPPLYELTFEYIDNDNEAALKIIQEAEEVALLSGDSLSIVKSKRVKGQILYFQERTYEAALTFNAALPVAIRNDFKREQLYIETFLGMVNLFTGRYDMALKFCFKNLDMAIQLRDKELIGSAYHSIGIAYYKLTDYQQALDYYIKSYQLHQFFQETTFYTLTNIGLCYAHLGDFPTARFYVERSLKDCGQNCPKKYQINIDYAFGLIDQREGLLISAENHFLKSYSFSKMVNDSRFALDNIYLLSEIYIQKKEFNKAEFYLKEAEKIIKRHIPFNLEMIKIYSRSSELYVRINNFQKASFYQAKYIELKDSIYNEQLTTSLMKIEAEYLERNNVAKIATQNEVILLKEKIIDRQGILNFLTGLLGLITLTFAIFIYRSYRQRKKMNVILEQKIKKRTQELELSRNELLTAIKERDLVIGRVAEGVSETINTIKGLCLTGGKEVSDPVACSYMERIDKTTCGLAACLHPLFQEKLLIPIS